MTIAEARQVDPQILEGLKQQALKIGDFVLSNGMRSKYYVDVKQATLTPNLARLVGKEVVEIANEVQATAIGGMIFGAIPIVCAALVVQPSDKLVACVVRKEQKKHGLRRWIEGPTDSLGDGTRCLVVDDVVTTGASTIDAIKRIEEEGLAIAGVVSVVDRLAGGKEAIAEITDAPYWALTTIDQIYPDRPDRNK